MIKSKSKLVAIIVAHPDDETLWAGGSILSHPSWNCFIISLCRASDSNRAAKFYQTLNILGAEGKMADLDDGPDQKPLNADDVEQAILEMLPQHHFDLIITHNSTGEYTRHLRHEEVSSAVIKLWHKGKISTNELYLFAYEDGNKQYYPKPIESAPKYRLLTKRIWQKKYDIITNVYGFNKDSFEAMTTPRAESFWQFSRSFMALNWLKNH